MNPVDHPRRRRQIEAIHRLGPRVIGEMLVEITDLDDLDAALERYARLDFDAVKALGADRFSPDPLTVVR